MIATVATDATLAPLQWKEALPLQIYPPMISPALTLMYGPRSLAHLCGMLHESHVCSASAAIHATAAAA